MGIILMTTGTNVEANVNLIPRNTAVKPKALIMKKGVPNYIMPI